MPKSSRTSEEAARRTDRSLRRVATVGAALGWAALLLQFWLTMTLSVTNGQTLAGGIGVYLSYFTILTNILAAVTLSVAARPAPADGGGFFRRASARTGVALSMLVVGIIYNLVLRGLWEPQGWQYVADVVLHVIMPVVFAGFWLLAVCGAGLTWRHIPRWLIYPVAYFVYAVIRGSLVGAFPYPFIDLDALGPGRVALNAIGILVGFAALGAVLVMIDKFRFKAGAASLQA